MRQTQPRAALAFDAGPISEYSQIISSMRVVPMLDFLSASEIEPLLLRAIELATAHGAGYADARAVCPAALALEIAAASHRSDLPPLQLGPAVTSRGSYAPLLKTQNGKVYARVPALKVERFRFTS